jgi:mono/diheme cytochrome c family protein
VEVGRVAAVADDGDDVVVLGDRGAQFFTGGTLTGADRRIDAWRGAAAIPAADGAGTWLAALDGTGTLHRVRARASLEPISDRYGLAGKALSSFAALGRGWLGFALSGDDKPSPPSGGIASFGTGGGSASSPASGGIASSPVSGGSASSPASGGIASFGTGGGIASSQVGGLLALADGHSVTTFSIGGTGPVAGGGGKVAWLEPGGVRVFEPGRPQSLLFPLSGAARAALDERGRLFAATEHEVYAEDNTGTLALVFETASEATAITGLAASSGRVWFSEGADLGIVEGARVAITTGLERPERAALAASSSGDIWSLAGGTLARFAVVTPAEAARATPGQGTSVGAARAGGPVGAGEAPSGVAAGDGEPPRRAASWSTGIAQIFARACASCHGAAPSSGIDLSTSAAWERRLPLLRRRVLVNRDMPPPGHPLSDRDREAIDAWTAPPRP